MDPPPRNRAVAPQSTQVHRTRDGPPSVRRRFASLFSRRPQHPADPAGPIWSESGQVASPTQTKSKQWLGDLSPCPFQRRNQGAAPRQLETQAGVHGSIYSEPSILQLNPGAACGNRVAGPPSSRDSPTFRGHYPRTPGRRPVTCGSTSRTRRSTWRGCSPKKLPHC